MNNLPAQVAEFNQLIIGIPRPPHVVPLSHDRAELGHRHLTEEANELLEAALAGDVVKTVDAAIDSIYLALGILYKVGLSPGQIEQCMAAVHESNMTKKRGAVIRNGVSHGEDAVKPSGWMPPEQKIKNILGLP